MYIYIGMYVCVCVCVYIYIYIYIIYIQTPSRFITTTDLSQLQLTWMQLNIYHNIGGSQANGGYCQDKGKLSYSPNKPKVQYQIYIKFGYLALERYNAFNGGYTSG